MAINNDDILEMFKDVLESFKEFFNSNESELDSIFASHLSNREEAEKNHFDNRKELVSRAIKNQIEEERLKAIEIAKINNESAEEIKRINDNFNSEIENRTSAAISKLEQSKSAMDNLYAQLKSNKIEIETVKNNINDLRYSGDSKDNIEAYEKDLKRLEKERLNIEDAIYRKKRNEEKNLNDLQTTLIKDEEKKRIKLLDNLEKRKKKYIEETGASYEDAEKEFAGERDNINSSFIENITNVSGGKLSVGGALKGIGSSILSGDKGGHESIIGNALDLGSQAASAIPGPWGIVASAVLKVGSVIADQLKAMHDALEKQVDIAMDAYTKYLGPINTRLQGTDKTFSSIVGLMQSNLRNNAYVDQTKYLENINSLVEKGIAFNVEERALMLTLSDKIATTFNALDESLLRLIRLQQADMTKSALGSEAGLTTYLNNNYNDTSYLGDEYSRISSIILDASSQMNIDQATSFNYAVQKWLGSLYSVGMSGSAVENIAQGLNYLSTGNVSVLNSNPSLMTLLSLSAERSGNSIASLLTSGLTSSNVNDLMKAMVEYLASIAENTSNQVTKSEFSNIVNMSVSDLRAISNLTSKDIATLYETVDYNYKTAVEETSQQLGKLDERTSIAEKLDNFLNNALLGFGWSITENQDDYLKFKMEDYIDRLAQDTGFGKLLSKKIIGSLFGSVGELLGLEATVTGLMGDVNAFNPEATSDTSSDSSYTLLDQINGNNSSDYNAGAFGQMNSDVNNIFINKFKKYFEEIKATLDTFGDSALAFSLEGWNSSIYNSGRNSDFIGLLDDAINAAAKTILNNAADKVENGVTTNNYSNDFSSVYDNLYASGAVSNLSSSAVFYDNNVVDIERTTTPSFEQQERAIQESGKNIQSTETSVDTNTKSIDDLYEDLFENQSTPIKVSLESAADKVYEKLISTISSAYKDNELTNLLRDFIASYEQNTSQNDVRDIISNLYMIRGI